MLATGNSGINHMTIPQSIVNLHFNNSEINSVTKPCYYFAVVDYECNLELYQFPLNFLYYVIEFYLNSVRSASVSSLSCNHAVLLS